MKYPRITITIKGAPGTGKSMLARKIQGVIDSRCHISEERKPSKSWLNLYDVDVLILTTNKV